MKGKKYYSDYHVWIEPIHPSVVRLGLSAQMREHLGDILHVDLPSLGAFVKEGEELCVLESSISDRSSFSGFRRGVRGQCRA